MKTGMPSLAAAARSIWLVPMQKAPIACSSGAASRALLAHSGFRADAQQLHSAQGVDQLGLVERTLDGCDLDAALSQQPDAFRMDVFQQ